MSSGATEPGHGPDPEGYDPHQFPPRAVTVDIVVFSVRHQEPDPLGGRTDGRLQVLVVQRDADAEVFPDLLALPGSFVRDDENLRQAAARVLSEKAQLDLPQSALEQFGAYGDPDRDPRMRVISIGFIARVEAETVPVDGFAGAADVNWRWIPVTDLLDSVGRSLAFDHAEIIRDAREQLRTAVEETDAALDLLPAQFTLKQLRSTYAAIWGSLIDPGNFAKRVARLEGFIEECDAPSESIDQFPINESPSPWDPSDDRWSIHQPMMSRTDRLFLSAPRLRREQFAPAMASSPPESATPSRGRGRPPKWFTRGTTEQLHPPLRRPGSYRSKSPTSH